jgi:hypothetical protein
LRHWHGRRLSPASILEHVVGANHASFSFDVVYALSESHDLYYNTAAGTSEELETNAFGLLDEPSARLALTAAAASSRTHTAHVIPRIASRTKDEWRRVILPQEAKGKGSGRLDRIEKYAGQQHTILNMYRQQSECAKSVELLEQYYGARFDYIISTREDTFFFRHVDLRTLLAARDGSCGLTARDCLSWGGINMRFQLLGRDVGLPLLRDRIRFYASLFGSENAWGRPMRFFNPEQFEMMAAEVYNVSTCSLSVEQIPVTVARHVRNGTFCFPPFEVMKGCFPRGAEALVRSRRCDLCC